MRDLTDIQLAQDTNMLYRGSMVNGDTLHSEAPPLYATTAFIIEPILQPKTLFRPRSPVNLSDNILKPGQRSFL